MQHLPGLGVHRRELLDGGDAVGAGADMNAAFRQRFLHAARPGDHVGAAASSVSIVNTASPNVAAALIEAIALGAGLGQRLDFFRRAVIDADFMAGIDEPARHDFAHAAKPDKSDFHGLLPTVPLPLVGRG